MPVLLLLSYFGFASLHAHWPNNFLDSGEPWRFLLVGVGGAGAAIWVVWRAFREPR